MGSHSVICHLQEVTFLYPSQLRLVLNLATPEGCKAVLKTAPPIYGALSLQALLDLVKLSCDWRRSGGLLK